MVFSSLTFLCVFLPAVFLLHTLFSHIAVKNALLVVASLLFYAYGEPIYILLMLASVFVNWLMGRLVGSAGDNASQKRVFLACAIVFNLAMLGVFKYAAFACDSLSAIMPIQLPHPEIALPIGISFYTFQAMSYVIDVYRGTVESEKSFLKVLLYISFFPQLIAGPIIKFHDVSEQLSSRVASIEDIASGLRRFCVGLGKKVLIANTLAIPVDALFATSSEHVNILGAWLAAICYMLQIYFDFSGYSDMAIGMARMFGFRFKENFQHPYCSTSIKEFWRRWHISLSTWFKEYVYIPLGGNRRGRARTVLNKFAVFFLCGLWHGAAWTFVVWGLIHGLFLMLEEYVPMNKLPKPIGWLYAMLVVCCAFVLFRADTFSQGAFMLSQMFTGFDFDHAHMVVFLQQLNPIMLGTLAIGLIAAQPISAKVHAWFIAQSGSAQRVLVVLSYVGAFALLVLCLLQLAGGGYNPFIYFRF